MSARITGMNELSRRLQRLPVALQRSAETAVLRAGAKPITKAAKGRAPVGTGRHSGLLKKSIGARVKKVRGITSARIGPRTKMAVSLGTKIARKTKGNRVAGQPYEAMKDPNKYAHLVEFGTSHSAAKPFIRPALDSSRNEAFEAMREGYRTHLVRVVNRLRNQ